VDSAPGESPSVGVVSLFEAYIAARHGHSARTVADRNYAAESEALLAEAVEWLGRQYGITDD
jgi:hypothetical protein